MPELVAVREKYFMRNAKFVLCIAQCQNWWRCGNSISCVMPNLYCVCSVPELVAVDEMGQAVREKYCMRNAKFIFCMRSARTGGGGRNGPGCARKILYA
jgi:hypothetical protein